MKNLLAFVLAAASAYSLSFALDLLLGGLLGFYPATAFLPVVTWSVIAAVSGAVALRLSPTGRFLVIPCLVFAGMALFGGIVGRHFSLIVGIGMLVQASGLWYATKPNRGRSVS
jgi:hypothetical protein